MYFFVILIILLFYLFINLFKNLYWNWFMYLWISYFTLEQILQEIHLFLTLHQMEQLQLH